MKIGLEHVISREKRIIDYALASLLLPASKCGELLVGQLIKRTSDMAELEPITRQTRIGKGNAPFTILKYTTLIPGTEEPIARWASLFRRIGADELGQIPNILTGDMTFSGPRPLLVPEYEEVMDSVSPKDGKEWERVIGQSRPGLYSTWGLLSHQGHGSDSDSIQQRVDSDIEDFYKASFARDAQIMREFVGLAVRNHLQ